MDRRVLLLPLIVFAAIVIAFQSRMPPAPSAKSGFSLGRAKAIVAEVTRAPHNVGTVEHARVREVLKAKLTAMGLDVRIQADMGVRQATKAGRGGAISISPLENIIAVLPGRNRNAPAVAVMTHYDSAPWSYGAADDGAGIAGVLETARVLTSGPQPERDVVFLVTDAEEVGLIGAQSFFESDPLAARVEAIVNLEARGSSGRAFMFQTSTGNSELIDLWANNAVSPTGNSMANAVYQLLPNDTDLSVPLEKNKIGINAAFVDSLHDYHMPTDTAANLDDRSLQHLGDFAVTTTRVLAMAKELPRREADSAYFDVFGLGVVRYPIGWGWVLSGLAVVILFASRIDKIGTSWRRSAWATLGMGWLFVAAGAACHGVAWLMYGSGSIAMRERINEMGSFLWIGIAICAAMALLVRPKTTSWVGAVALLTIASLIAQYFLPGANWLFGWAALIGAIIVFMTTRLGLSSPAVIWCSAIPGGIWGAFLLQGVISTYVSTAPMTPAPIALVVPFAIALIGPVIMEFGEHRWSRPIAFGVLGLAAIGSLWLAATSSFSPRMPKPGDLFHMTDTNTGKAYWATTSSKRELPPGQTEAFVAKGFSHFNFLRVHGPPTLAIPPSFTMVRANGRSTLHMAGNGEPHRAMMFLVKPSRTLTNATVNGKPVKLAGGQATRISYRAQTAGAIDLTFDDGTGGSIAIDYLYGSSRMPAGAPTPAGPTTDWTMFSDSKLVVGSTKVVW